MDVGPLRGRGCRVGRRGRGRRGINGRHRGRQVVGHHSRVICAATEARWAAFAVTLGRLLSLRRLTVRLTDIRHTITEAAVAGLLLEVLGHGVPRLTALAVYVKEAIPAHAGVLVRGQPALRHLRFPHVAVWAQRPAHVGRTMALYGGMRGRLRSFDLGGLAGTLDVADALPAFLDRLPELPAVRHLALGEGPPVGRAVLAVAARACPAATSLSISFMIADIDSEAGAEALAAQFPRLRTLNHTAGYRVWSQSVSAPFVMRLVCRVALHTLFPHVEGAAGGLAAALPPAPVATVASAAAVVPPPPPTRLRIDGPLLPREVVDALGGRALPALAALHLTIMDVDVAVAAALSALVGLRVLWVGQPSHGFRWGLVLRRDAALALSPPALVRLTVAAAKFVGDAAAGLLSTTASAGTPTLTHVAFMGTMGDVGGALVAAAAVPSLRSVVLERHDSQTVGRPSDGAVELPVAWALLARRRPDIVLLERPVALGPRLYGAACVPRCDALRTVRYVWTRGCRWPPPRHVSATRGGPVRGVSPRPDGARRRGLRRCASVVFTWPARHWWPRRRGPVATPRAVAP
eukprot:TRINITY_DN4158_c0_g1_i1.p2 TRINITY_DN4158_c0_g1~~TRINITY_DN4158_c0_g1_i1.p2  ORF type:complete len:599 (+),score=144.70 TRINITY_DN4158_c0_g1_i1:67-1797(+)